MVILVLTSTIVSDDGVTQLVKVTSPAGSGKRFMRLRVNKTALAEISIQQTAGTSLVSGAEVWSRSFLAQHRLFMDYFIETAFGMLRVHGFPTFNIDAFWPGVSDIAWVSFLLYLIVFDFVHYLIHRGQHQFNRWWALHSLHHSQRQMTLWTDNRNHLLDDVITALLLSVVAKLIGVGPGQFIALVVLSQLSESFQHANIRCSFGWLGDRLWVSPRFHRLHHAIGIGHESAGRKTMGGHNFGVLFPWWDMMFKTVDFSNRYDPTGVRDQVEEGREYGQSFWAQQKLGFMRFLSKSTSS